MTEFKNIVNKEEQPWWNNAQIFYKQFEPYMNNEEKDKIKIFINYKVSIKDKVNLLKTREFRSDNFNRNIRLKMKILLGTL